MQITIAPETELLLREEIRHGQFRSADELIQASVRALRAQNAARRSAVRVPTTGDERAHVFVQWARSHRNTTPLSDEAVSRASMNPDRG